MIAAFTLYNIFVGLKSVVGNLFSWCFYDVVYTLFDFLTTEVR